MGQPVLRTKRIYTACDETGRPVWEEADGEDYWDSFWPRAQAWGKEQISKQNTGPDMECDSDYVSCEQAAGVQCGWVTGAGRWIGCEYGEHSSTLSNLCGDVEYSDVEARGWIHAGGRNDTDCPRHDGNRLSPRQIKALEAHGYNPNKE